jgi:hypothetical protein
MPGVNLPADANQLAAILNNLQAQITALQTQQLFIATDKNYNPRVRLGLLPDGDYGLAIYSAANDGTYVEINVPVVASYAGTLTTSSTSYTTLTNSPTLSVTVGASGKAFVSLSGTIGTSSTVSGTPAQGKAQMYVDGVASGLVIAASITVNTSAFGVQSTNSNAILVTGLSQGTHTLSIEYESPFGQSQSFTGMTLTAIPY